MNHDGRRHWKNTGTSWTCFEHMPCGHVYFVYATCPLDEIHHRTIAGPNPSLLLTGPGPNPSPLSTQGRLKVGPKSIRSRPKVGPKSTKSRPSWSKVAHDGPKSGPRLGQSWSKVRCLLRQDRCLLLKQGRCLLLQEQTSLLSRHAMLKSQKSPLYRC